MSKSVKESVRVRSEEIVTPQTVFQPAKIYRLSTQDAIVGLRLLRLKMHIFPNADVNAMIRTIWVDTIVPYHNPQFLQASLAAMIYKTLSYEHESTHEDVVLAINLLLEMAKKDSKLFKYWNC